MPTVFGGGGGVAFVPGAAAGINTETYACPVGVAVRDAVYLSAADAVDKADASNAGKRPAIGFVVDKPTTTTAVVQFEGGIGGFSGLTVGATYYLATSAGGITATAPSSTGDAVQKVGFAEDATTIHVEVDRDFVVL